MTTVKDAVRARLLETRKAMSPKDREDADRATWNALRGLLGEVLNEGAAVAAYRPFGAEPCATLRPEIPERLADHYKVLLPVTLPDNDLDWTVVGSEVRQSEAPEDSWSGVALTGPRGTEGIAATCGPEAIREAAAVIVPGLAVSNSGIRLGRGGGSYDRALARLRPDVPVVALLRDGEFDVAVPAEPHDRPVTGVITPADGFVTVG
ncbi:5-formyltetrahydrofolate cyclo-ligase [Glycomyces sp. L485]|uniref:5-formyltetrahydrofolate cyclo-ligase n=1 Tax=Glycomyces sp. L485 TaxID=2909235 RepID=UPI001F4ACC6A|nr:5-formyltetrahydrofolate cyclo-ligase [Glycomyces sp. L485]